MNRFATDLNVDMKNLWWADEDFLRCRNKVQLQKIINEAGFSSQFSNVAEYKKGELVKKLAKLFSKEFSEYGHSQWLPEAMQFPAINPDKPQVEEDAYEEFDGEIEDDQFSDEDE